MDYLEWSPSPSPSDEIPLSESEEIMSESESYSCSSSEPISDELTYKINEALVNMRKSGVVSFGIKIRTGDLLRNIDDWDIGY